MRNPLSLQLTNQAPPSIGVYWGEAGLCLVRRDADDMGACVYQSAAETAATATPLTAVLQRLMRNESTVGRRLALSVAIDADDVFVRDMKVPVGLSDAQLEQVAITEAVANLPVPPEEICLDFIRLGEAEVGREGRREENVRLAFCRRERLDAILAQTEGAPVSVRVVDRDAQALHDVAAAHLTANPTTEESTGALTDTPSIYPFALLLTEIKPRLLICLAPLALESYALRLPTGDATAWITEIAQQISSCWRRCRLGPAAENLSEREALRQIVCIGAADAAFRAGLAAQIGLPVLRLPIKEQRWVNPNDAIPPDEALLIAAGMVGRA